jgi:hypothetical protein
VVERDYEFVYRSSCLRIERSRSVVGEDPEAHCLPTIDALGPLSATADDNPHLAHGSTVASLSEVIDSHSNAEFPERNVHMSVFS